MFIKFKISLFSIIQNLILKEIQHYYLPPNWSDKGCKDTVINLALPSLTGGSLEITLTIHLRD